jgi:hypothetical protein
LCSGTPGKEKAAVKGEGNPYKEARGEDINPEAAVVAGGGVDADRFNGHGLVGETDEGKALKGLLAPPKLSAAVVVAVTLARLDK